MKKLSLLIAFIAIFNISAIKTKSIYDYTVKTIDGNEYAMSQLKGKKVMIVNVASKCGYTKQYIELQKIYKTYGGENFEIIGFPSNDFLSQEPGSNKEIKEFCTLNYGVTFPMMEKISVKSGKKQAPIYQWLTKKKLNEFSDSKVKWNFQKYLIDENGKLVRIVPTQTSPADSSIIKWIEGK